MVDGIASTARVTLHQALHGYAEGHGQLATSVNLKPRDNKTLLILSDISGPGAPLDDAGYLTGYPLPELRFLRLCQDLARARDVTTWLRMDPHAAYRFR